MKTYKNIGFGPRKGKKGFTLIELLIVMVILAILAGVVVMAVGGVFRTNRERAYDVTKNEIKNAVAHYASENHGALPNASMFDRLAGDGVTKANVHHPVNEDVVLCDAVNGLCFVIDIDLLLTSAEPPGILGSAPASASPDNCTGCTGSYTWLMDNQGNIYSACTDNDACEGMIASDQWGNMFDGYCNPTYP